MMEHLEDMIIDIEKRLITESREEGIKIGKEDGIRIGTQNGMKIGKEDGIRIGTQNGIKIGKEDGIKIGTEKTKIDFAKAMIKNNYSKKEILKISKINESQYNQIQKDLSN